MVLRLPVPVLLAVRYARNREFYTIEECLLLAVRCGQ